MTNTLQSIQGEEEHAQVMARTGERVTPRNIEVEQALLGAILRDNRVFEKISSQLREEHFFATEHQKVFRMIRTKINEGKEARPTTIKHLVDADPLLSEAGGFQYLHDLAMNVVTVVNASDYAEIIIDLHRRRDVIQIAYDMVNDAFDVDGGIETRTLIDVANLSLFKLLETSAGPDGGPRRMDEIMRATLEKIDKAMKNEDGLDGLSLGFKEIDRVLGGCGAGNVTILAGRPAMGKTLLIILIMIKVASQVREDGSLQSVLMFSLEMTVEQLGLRLLSSESHMEHERIRRGRLNTKDFQKLADFAQRLSGLSIHIDDEPMTSIGSMMRNALSVSRHSGLDLIVVDYIGLVDPEKKTGNRNTDLTEISRGLKTLAKRLNCHVIVLSQLNRSCELREDKRPTLADIRDSGAIEQDADNIGFLYRPEYYLAREEPLPGSKNYEQKHLDWMEQMHAAQNKLEVIWAKNRHGPNGTATLHFDGSIMNIADPGELNELPMLEEF